MRDAAVVCCLAFKAQRLAVAVHLACCGFQVCARPLQYYYRRRIVYCYLAVHACCMACHVRYRDCRFVLAVFQPFRTGFYRTLPGICLPDDLCMVYDSAFGQGRLSYRVPFYRVQRYRKPHYRAVVAPRSAETERVADRAVRCRAVDADRWYKRIYRRSKTYLAGGKYQYCTKKSEN